MRDSKHNLLCQYRSERDIEDVGTVIVRCHESATQVWHMDGYPKASLSSYCDRHAAIGGNYPSSESLFGYVKGSDIVLPVAPVEKSPEVPLSWAHRHPDVVLNFSIVILLASLFILVVAGPR